VLASDADNRREDALEEVAMPRVNSFTVPADDPERAVKFYRGVFEWRLEEHQTPQAGTKYWLVQTESGSEPGINGALSQREFPGQPIGISIEVPSVETSPLESSSMGASSWCARPPSPTWRGSPSARIPKGTRSFSSSPIRPPD
jgi:predicted enzyme related to lactoylglutathione lyase